ncbi:MAG: 50S ribosomal protein L4 [Armatimonadota bacterium]
MATVPIYDREGSQTGELSLADEVFGVRPNRALLHQVVVAAQAALRQGSHDTKTRGEVAGSTRKLWRQKGTGRARVGDRRSPSRSGGGVAMGPHPRSYRQRLPRAAKIEGLRSALSAQVESGALLVLESLELPEAKTKLLKGVLDSVGVGGRALLVLAAPDEVVWRSGRNIPGLAIMPASDVNALDVISARKVVVLREAIAALEARLS